MAIFSRSKKKDAQSKPVLAEKTSVTDRNLTSVLKKPRVTEKAVRQSERNVYTFIVQQAATKYDVMDAVRTLYGVVPLKVNIVNKASRTVLKRGSGRRVSEKSLRTAYVYLKSGDSISLV